jgi:hypothetical protein
LLTSNKPVLSERERAIRQRLKDDLEHYAARCPKIRTKTGKIEPLRFNRMQKHLHSQIEEHAGKNAGRVRVLILKARQQCCSTYVGARFYHKATHARGQEVFILTHEQDATDNLFDMAVRFPEHCPELVKPHTGAANAKELVFDRLDSGYSVGTARSKAVGRSKTLQLFLGSEVAHWPNARDHFAGVMQAVPDLPGTEVILESTGHGVGGEFHERWQQAEAGIGDYEAIFVPWFWSDEYRREVPPGFVLDDEELECMELHGLELDQMVRRRAKIHELKDRPRARHATREGEQQLTRPGVASPGKRRKKLKVFGLRHARAKPTCRSVPQRDRTRRARYRRVRAALIHPRLPMAVLFFVLRDRHRRR